MDIDNSIDDTNGNTNTNTTEAETPERFDVETAKQMFSFRGKTKTGEGVDVSIIRDHYHPDVRFQDAIQVVHGKDAVIEVGYKKVPEELRDIVSDLGIGDTPGDAEQDLQGDGTGRVVYLTGMHTWNSLVDIGPGDPPPKFDFDAYLDAFAEYNHNFIRLWTWESPSP